jgi:hypothetical protein
MSSAPAYVTGIRRMTPELGLNTRASLGFPQDRREVPLATGISGSPNGVEGSDLDIL